MCLHFGRAGSHRGLPERYPLKAKLTGRGHRVLTEGCSDIVLTPSRRRESSKVHTAKKEQIHREGRDSCSWKTLVGPVIVGSRMSPCCCAPAVPSGYWPSLSKVSEKAQRGPGLP